MLLPNWTWSPISEAAVLPHQPSYAKRQNGFHIVEDHLPGGLPIYNTEYRENLQTEQ